MSVHISTRARMRRVLSRTVRPVQFALRGAKLRAVDSLLWMQTVNPDPYRVLIVRLDNIGDFVVWLDAARAIVEHFHKQGKRVTLLANTVWADFARDLGLFGEVLALDPRAFRHDLSYRRRTLSSIRRAGFGAVLEPTRNRVTDMGDAVVRWSGAPARIGVAAASDKAGTTDALYTSTLVAAHAPSEMQANAAIVRALTGAPYEARVADLRSAVHQAKLDHLRLLLPDPGYVVLFPGASAPGRQWPRQRFAELAQRCVQETGRPVLLCGGPGDVEMAAQIARDAGPQVVSLAGQTTLTQLTAVIAGAQLLVSNETSAIHIAAALGVPSICILGGGHFGRFVPYALPHVAEKALPLVAAQPMECFGCNWVCKFHPARGKPMPCIEQIETNSVWQLASPLLTVQQEPVCV